MSRKARSKKQFKWKDKKLVGAKENDKSDVVLSHKEAQAASPADVSIGGEEDPGVALEWVVTNDNQSASDTGERNPA